MFRNLLVAVSNFPSIFPMYQAFLRKDYLTTGIISFVAGASFLSHLVENHKHGMPGIGFSKKISYFLNRLDVIGCFLVGSRFMYMYCQKYGVSFDVINQNKLAFFICSLPRIFWQGSEYDKYNPNLRNTYIILHSIWHLSIFTSMNYVLTNFLY